MKFDWNGIDTVLLDMDGTLLDRHFDDHFWLEHVPKRYAARNSIPLDEAKILLYALFRSQERTLNWTDLDYWSERLGLDIPVLKQEVDHLIAVHPGVVEFLLFLRQHGKQAWLVTNAHGKTLSLKMRKTRLGHYFTGIISAHDLGLPKEDVQFWGKLRERIPYEPSRTMLGEDSETNLGTAEEYGIAHLVYVSRYSSAVTPIASGRYASIHYFTQLIPTADTDVTVLPP
ncbi:MULTISPECIES: GMP/IMP nucleotidase [Geobacter]|uniref:Haloacid dehalogenase n=2 Tax=Geobacter TaxID=28231 RepID=A0A0C1TN68_9BACT|nr:MULTISPECIES: GMP/IMP nucleotidase [Geobacter]ANA40340.1 haloacid dehalogenase [Geobacter anodireducens]KIE42339.1 haloacid dehalogenase [Geobacter soli]MBE2887347.1 GMP/IMP nucleotidase [Geobacter anodireducens]HMN01375.1 GMP/IMP nucleotidase [Geobacter anodireducens]